MAPGVPGGALWDWAARHDRWLTWAALTATGLGCAAAVAALARTGRLRAADPEPVGA
ncbi:hypothetical protein ACGH2B_14460 [Streptomyces sp. BBFR2]|uniref:hypothetical protein n=1 Tax=Streptomyces sp. BBFR2 TaxID=3372854 RepID=UPI0037D9EDB1